MSTQKPWQFNIAVYIQAMKGRENIESLFHNKLPHNNINTKRKSITCRSEIIFPLYCHPILLPHLGCSPVNYWVPLCQTIDISGISSSDNSGHRNALFNDCLKYVKISLVKSCVGLMHEINTTNLCSDYICGRWSSTVHPDLWGEVFQAHPPGVDPLRHHTAPSQGGTCPVTKGGVPGLHRKWAQPMIMTCFNCMMLLTN